MNPYTLRGMIRNPTEFFGRNRELREIFALLRRPASCSIVGPGASGSRLCSTKSATRPYMLSI